MKFDIFFSICQTPVDGYLPTEQVMFQNFFDQVKLADRLGYGVAWVAETHLSCQTQKRNRSPVIPTFEGEIGLNTDILQLAHLGLAQTTRIEFGSAIRNIQCNGGPIAHAEAIRMFLSLRQAVSPDDNRRLHVGFAAGRFPFSNTPYGIFPRNSVEEVAWPVVKNRIFQEATEIFLRLLKGEVLSSSEIQVQPLKAVDFRTPEDFKKTIQAYGKDVDSIPIDNRWKFEEISLIPQESPLQKLTLTIGSHDPETQILANQFLPVGVFNLSITPDQTIEETHVRMSAHYHQQAGTWDRSLMPRTCLIFLDPKDSARAKDRALKAWANYWRAMEGTLDPKKVEQAVNNAIYGTPEQVAQQLRQKYHPDDRLLLWFDFNNHDNEDVKSMMQLFMEDVAPRLES